MPFPFLSNRSTPGSRSPASSPYTSSTTLNDRPRPTMQVKDIMRSRQITSSQTSPSTTRLHPDKDHTKKDISRFISSFRYKPPTTGSGPPLSAKLTLDAFVVNDQGSDNDMDNRRRSARNDDNSDDENSFNDKDSDSDDGSMNDSDDDDLFDYLGDTALQDNLLDSSSLANKLAMLRERFPDKTRGMLLKVLQDNDGRFTTASLQLLNTNRTAHQEPSAKRPRPAHPSPVKRTKLKSGSRPRSDSSASDSDDDDDYQRPKTMPWEERKELLEAVQTVDFYNTAKSQDIMDVTGCNVSSAEKLASLRPFESLQDLHDKLKRQRGVSVQYIKAYMELMEGYSAVDQIIQNIEHTGTQLQNILDVWQQFESVATEPKDDDAGTHLVDMDRMCGGTMNKDTANYKDAMDGFLTQQPAIVNPQLSLKSYQIIGVNWMLLLYRKGISGILADEMGLGKTAQVISFLGRLYELGELGPHLIVVPASTLDNWLREFERFCPKLNVRCYYGSQSERTDLQDDINDNLKNIHVVVTTYSMASGNAGDRSFLRRLRCKSMILDEGHMIKNYTSSRYGHLMRMGTPFRLLLTGTPLQNNLQELVSLLIFIMPKVFSGNEEDIRKIFKLKAQKGNDGSDGDQQTTTATSSATKAIQMLSQQRIQRAKKMMTPFVLRRRKAQVLSHLPQKIHKVEYCTMTSNQHAFYKKLIVDSQQPFKDELSNSTNVTKKKMDKFSNLIMHLRKAADHPLLFRRIYNDDTIKQMAKEIMKEERYLDANEQYIYEDMEAMSDFELNALCLEFDTLRHHALKNEEWMDAGKIQYLRQLLPQMKQDGSKVLIFSQFTSMLDILELVMDTLGLSFIRLDGSTKVGERQSLIDEFNQDDSLDVFLLSTKAGGFGINLTSANVVVMYDMDFNPQNDKQAEDRAHRVGQTKNVTVYKLLSHHTIDHQILAMAEMRLRLDSSVSGIDDDQHQDNDTVDQTKMKSLLKSVLLPS